jgi:hypothetical protein
MIFYTDAALVAPCGQGLGSGQRPAVRLGLGPYDLAEMRKRLEAREAAGA